MTFEELKKNLGNKIKWKKVAAVGGVFLLGTVVGGILGAVVGGIGVEKILNGVSLDDCTDFGCRIFKTTDHSALIRFTITSPKTGRVLNTLLTEKDALKMSEDIAKALNELGVEVKK